VTAAEAEAAWAAYRFVPHVLRDVTTVDTRVRLLEEEYAAPIAVAPTTLQRAVHPDGEVAMASACQQADALMVVSSNAGTKYDDSPSVWETIDPGMLRINFGSAYDDSAPGSEKARNLSPHDIGWLRETTGLPVVVKGVVRPDDARRAIQAGAAAVWVSNHGGRQLDRTLPTAAALPSVVSAVEGEAEIYVDGGVRSGSDVLAALSLGATGVFLGRLPLYALVDGRDGVVRLYEELINELVEAMRLAGCRTVADTPGIAAPEG